MGNSFWISELEGGRMFEVEISGWCLFPRKHITRALIQIQREYKKKIYSVRRFPGMWTHHYLVFTD